MNIDKIQQCCTDGTDMVVIGDVANGTDEGIYTHIERTGTFSAEPAHQGVLWLVVGTDSGFEGRTTLYYIDIAGVCEEIYRHIYVKTARKNVGSGKGGSVGWDIRGR